MKCMNCGADLKDNDVFCGSCGTKVSASGGGAIEQDHAAVSEPVGEAGPVTEAEPGPVAEARPEPEAEADPVTEAVPEPVAENAAEFAAAAVPGPISAEKPYPSVKGMAAGKGAVMAVVVGVAAVAILGIYGISRTAGGNRSSGHPKVVYYKEDSMLLTDLKKKEPPVELTDTWCDDDAPMYMKGITSQRFISKDGTCLYYIEDYDNHTYNLYRASVSKPEDAVKVDSKVEYHIILENNDVIYRKKDSCYYSDGKNKVKFGKNVSQFYLNDTQTEIIWMERGDNYSNFSLYYQPLNQKEDKIRLENSADNFFYSKDMKNFWVLKGGSLSKISPDGTKERLVKKVESVVSLNPEAGTFYFTRAGKQKLALKDLMTAGKGEQKRLDALADQTATIPTLELYYYDGSQETLMSDRIPADSEFKSSMAAYCVYPELPEWDSIEIPLSEMGSMLNSDPVIAEYLTEETAASKLSIGQTEAELPEEIRFVLGSSYFEDSGMLYLIGSEEPDEEEGILYQVSLKGGSKDGTVTELDQDAQRIAAVSKKGVYYYKDYEKSSGDLYFNGEYIMPDVYEAFCLPESDLLVCATDYDTEDTCGTIVIYDGKNVKTVADYVMFIEGGADGTLLMLADYDRYNMEGDLLYYNGSETSLIDDDVMGFAMRYGSIRNWKIGY